MSRKLLLLFTLIISFNLYAIGEEEDGMRMDDPLEQMDKPMTDEDEEIPAEEGLAAEVEGGFGGGEENSLPKGLPGETEPPPMNDEDSPEILEEPAGNDFGDDEIIY